jgi:hypothetical protein
MWIPLLAMAVAVSLEPFRIGMTILMMNRPRPLLHLLAFLTGGFVMGVTVGMIVLFILRPALASAHSALPRVQIVVGVVLLANAAVLATGMAARRSRARDGGAPGRVSRIFGPFATRGRQLLDGGSLWTAGAAGLGIALPSVDYLAALALIVASGAVAAVQVSALVLFNVVAFGFVEIPLLCYLVAPDRTLAAISALQDWLHARRRHALVVLLTAVGCVLLGAGLVGL